MKLSIIIPVYNTEEFVARAITSCINQSFQDLEIIIVDDCGNDKSMEIAYRFAKADPRIKIIHNPKNLKLLQTRLEGAKVATSEYMTFLDSDDYLESDICKKVIETLEKSQNLDLLCFEMLAEIPNGFKKFSYGATMNTALSRETFCEMILQNGKYNWNLCGKVFKRETFLKALKLIDPPRLNMAEDALIFFLVLSCTSSLFILKQNGYYYCSNDQSITRNNDLSSRIINMQEEEKVIELISSKLPTIKERAFAKFAKTMLKELNFIHHNRKINLLYLKHPNLFFRAIASISNRANTLLYHVEKKINRWLYSSTSRK